MHAQGGRLSSAGRGHRSARPLSGPSPRRMASKMRCLERRQEQRPAAPPAGADRTTRTVSFLHPPLCLQHLLELRSHRDLLSPTPLGRMGWLLTRGSGLRRRGRKDSFFLYKIPPLLLSNCLIGTIVHSLRIGFASTLPTALPSSYTPLMLDDFDTSDILVKPLVLPSVIKKRSNCSANASPPVLSIYAMEANDPLEYGGVGRQ